MYPGEGFSAWVQKSPSSLPWPHSLAQEPGELRLCSAKKLWLEFPVTSLFRVQPP